MKNVIMIIVGVLLVMGSPVMRHHRCAAAETPSKAAERIRANVLGSTNGSDPKPQLVEPEIKRNGRGSDPFANVLGPTNGSDPKPQRVEPDIKRNGKGSDPFVGPSRADVVMISIRPNVQTDAKVIRLSDVATITGGDAVLREQLKQLDLDDGVSPGETITILPPQIEFRLRIAAVDVDRVSIRGNGVRVQARSAVSKEADVVTHMAATTIHPKARRAVDFSSISIDEGPLEHEVVAAAKNCVMGKLPWPADKVDIRLSQPVSTELRQVSSAAGYECAAEMRTTGPAMGRIQLRVFASAPGKPTFDIPVLLEVRHFDQVVLTTKAFDRGHILTANDLYIDRQDVTDFSDYCSEPKDVIGSSVKRSLRALSPLRQGDVEAANRSDSGIVIKRREQVKMLAKAGGLVVSATGEALEDGRMGESIRLRNTVSNANVQGRVIGQGEVEISY